MSEGKIYCSHYLAKKFDFSYEQCTVFIKFHFLATFLLKMGSTVLFIHLKLFCYSVFSFQFQQNKFYPNGPLVFGIRVRQGIE